MDLLRRIRWGNVARAAALLTAVGLVLAWPSLRSDPPPLPPEPALASPREKGEEFGLERPPRGSGAARGARPITAAGKKARHGRNAARAGKQSRTRRTRRPSARRTKTARRTRTARRRRTARRGTKVRRSQEPRTPTPAPMPPLAPPPPYAPPPQSEFGIE